MKIVIGVSARDVTLSVIFGGEVSWEYECVERSNDISMSIRGVGVSSDMLYGDWD